MHFTKVIRAGTTPIILGKMLFLLISENEFFHEIKPDEITNFHGIHVGYNESDSLFCLITHLKVRFDHATLSSLASLREGFVASFVLSKR